ncbi:MAG: DNA import protein CedA1 [Saccharolobus sp.]
MTNIVNFVQNLDTQVTEVAWSIFILAWAVGWALRGSPIPIFRVKRAGQDLIEDAILAAFWLALGTTVFSLITYIASQVGS